MMTTEDDNQLRSTSEAAELLRRLAGEYGLDERLPSVRELSQVLGVSETAIDPGPGNTGAAPAGNPAKASKTAKTRVGVRTSPEDVQSKQVHIALDPHIIQSPSASPVWGQMWGMLLTTAEQRSAAGSQSFVFHMSNSLEQPGPIRDLFLADL